MVGNELPTLRTVQLGSLKSQISLFRLPIFYPILPPYPCFSISFSTQAIVSPKAARAVWRAM